MNAPSNTPPSKGMMMIAAYRAERLNRRSALRTTLPNPHVAPAVAASSGPEQAGPVEVAQADATAVTAVAATDSLITKSTSIFANPVRMTVADRQSDVAASKNADLVEEQALPASVVAVASPDDRNHAEMATAQTAEPQAIPVVDRSDTSAARASVLSKPCMQTASSELQAYDPPLAELGFGPGMLIRLGQLGLYTTADLAQADAGRLRVALGDISRLVDVEAWISSAHEMLRTATPE